MLILLIIAVGTQSEDWSALLFEHAEQDVSRCPVNTQSIAEISGVPRESVRRKLQTLSRRGWVCRNESGQWEVTAQSARDLRPSSQAAISYLLRIFQAVRPCENSADTQSPIDDRRCKRG
jgi:hypothetical protein